MAVGAERVDPATKHPDLVVDLGPAVRASGLFAEPVITRQRFDVTFTAEEYASNLSTQSGVKELPPMRRPSWPAASGAASRRAPGR